MKVTDPVCGMQCDEKDVVGRTTYDGNTYSFCDPTCQKMFTVDPDKYVGERKSATWPPETGRRGGGSESARH
jgi:YHS domain-containing protein